MADMVDKKIKDPETSLDMKDALLKLELGLRSVEVVELRQKLTQQVQKFNRDMGADESKKTSE